MWRGILHERTDMIEYSGSNIAWRTAPGFPDGIQQTSLAKFFTVGIGCFDDTVGKRDEQLACLDELLALFEGDIRKQTEHRATGFEPLHADLSVFFPQQQRRQMSGIHISNHRGLRVEPSPEQAGKPFARRLLAQQHIEVAGSI